MTTKHNNPTLDAVADDEPIFVLRARDYSLRTLSTNGRRPWVPISPTIGAALRTSTRR